MEGLNAHILLCGNDIAFVTAAGNLLDSKGYRVTRALSGREMLAELRKGRFEMVLIDGRAEPDEIALSRAIQRTDPGLPVVLICSNGQAPSDRVFFDYLKKPFDEGELLMRVSRAVEFRRLRTSENLYRLVYKNAAEGIYLSTAQGKYIQCNAALSRLLGYESPEELITDLNKEGTRIYPDAALRRRITRLMQKREVLAGIESRTRRKDGSRVWVSENVCRIKDEAGAFICLKGTVEDIGQRKRAEEQLRESEKYHKLQCENAERNRAVFLEIIDDIYGSYRDLDELFVSFVATLVKAIDERTRWRKGHSEMVASYSVKIAKAMGVNKDETEALHLAALLHDIGQLAVSAEILGKPARLSDAEFKSIKTHPVYGAIMLARVRQLKDIIPLIRHHHERPDGGGYPDGLRGDEIPMGARILHLADSFDSMNARRPYRSARGKAYALGELERCRNTHFDPEVTDAALKVL